MIVYLAVRFNALSRVVEGALQAVGIPNRVLAGYKFFERLEVSSSFVPPLSSLDVTFVGLVQIKDLLAYLQLVDNPLFTPAFARAVNVPSRGIGEKVSCARHHPTIL